MKKLFSVFAASILLVGCSSEETTKDSPPTPVSVAQIEDYRPPAATYTATLTPRFRTPVAFRVAGRVDQRHIEVGEQVKQGQLLASLDPADFGQRLQAAEASRVAAQEVVKKATNDLERGKSLFRTGAINDEQLERYQVALEEAQSGQQQASSELKQAENALSYTRLEAPLAGTVVSVEAAPGLVVNPAQPVLQLAQGGPLQATIDLPGKVSAPGTASIKVDGKSYELELFSASNTLDPQSFTRRVRYNLNTEPEHFAFGQLAEATLPIATDFSAESALTIPVTAIDERGQQAHVWVIQEGKATVAPVTVLDVTTQTATITSEQLSAGEQIISHGINRLTEGQKVRAVQ
ncbi:efflux RND transporter periplasmic adaptor subunit [Marinobacter sp. ATCH36]|uniref:efflux RND transporter periplasmic adaptor subunit n=1 Tax=Marinobacter sp. ATCH36 TaxID=2945106 RepID=UPI002020AC9B|nr:efflux RND transporter periplasmic adaptor subunit [Marinobacter sp. ATCH36]MCL7943073.1 efflux RND transporter periplasmic adaptor subunit [Marinobacter sp. ATCH36]